MAVDTGTKRSLSWATYSGRDDDGHPEVQPRTNGDEGGTSIKLEHPYGCYSRPHDPEAGNDGQYGYCTLFVERDGPTQFAHLGYDPRFIDLIPLPPKGSQMTYAAFKEDGKWKAAFDYMSGDDGTKCFYLPTKGSAMAVTFGKDRNGESTIEFRHPDGSLISMFKGSIVLKSPAGKSYIEVNDDGIVLRGKITLAGPSSPPGGVPATKHDAFVSAMRALQTICKLEFANATGAADAGDLTVAAALASFEAAIATGGSVATKVV